MSFGTRIFSALMFAFATSVACAQTLRWSSQGDLQTLDPHSQNEILTNSINRQVYESLTRFDSDMRVVPALATEWTAVSSMLWRVKLRPGVKFHDGSPLTADDVVFSVVRAQHPASPFRTYAIALGTPRKVDDLTVEFQLREVDPIWPSHAATIAIMSRSWCEANNAATPLDFKNKEAKYTNVHANGTGPFVLVSRQPESRTVFKRNAAYWGRFDGNVQEVIYQPIGNDATRTAALLSGDVDFVLDPPPQDVARMRSTAGIKVVDGPENRVIFIGMDQGRDELLYSNIKGRNPLKDLRVRKALYAGIDIEALKRVVMRGQSAPTGAMTPSPLGTYNDPALEARYVPYDPAAARQLLADAGYPQGFEVQFDCPNNRYINDQALCEAVAGMWARIGVKAKVVAMPRALYFPRMEKLDTSVYLFGWGGAVVDADIVLTPVLHSRGEAGKGYSNFGNYRNTKLDQLIEESSHEHDSAKREKLVKAALREQQEQVHYIPLHRQVIPWAMRSNVTARHRPDNALDWREVSVASTAH